jgi:hypothetical protein
LIASGADAAPAGSSTKDNKMKPNRCLAFIAVSHGLQEYVIPNKIKVIP